MLCPKCNETMQTVTYASIDVERCDGCKGLWFDMLEKEHLAAIDGSEAIDIGSAKTGKGFNEMGDIKCPHCHDSMLRMVDAQQPHIWYEACPSCYGVYFDAGEFRDYKEKTIMDFFRDLFAKERP